MVERYLHMFSLRPLDAIAAVVEQHRSAPERRLAQRALADELTDLVHGTDALEAARAATEVLFGGDPTTASEATLAAVSREVPSSRVSRASLDDLLGVLVTAGLATSNSDARRTLQQKGFRANGAQLGEDSLLTDVQLLHGRYLLLRKGKSNHHLVEIS
jgi:tyrosyl-tRNA synthetase